VSIVLSLITNKLQRRVLRTKTMVSAFFPSQSYHSSSSLIRYAWSLLLNHDAYNGTCFVIECKSRHRSTYAVPPSSISSLKGQYREKASLPLETFYRIVIWDWTISFIWLKTHRIQRVLGLDEYARNLHCWWLYIVSLVWNTKSGPYFTVQPHRKYAFCVTCFLYKLKGTVSWDRFQKCWRKVTDLGLNKGRGWFLNFSDSPLIFSWNKTSSFR
jgi:hypothetical protein